MANLFFRLFFWMFIHHLSKFDKFPLKIGGEITFQSWLLLTPFFNLTIVHWFCFSPLCVFMCVLRFPVWYNAYLHWLFVFCPLFVSKSLLKVLGPDNAKSQCLHLYKYSLLCVLRFTLKLYAWKDAYWHRLNLFDGSPPCIFNCAFKLPFLVEAYSHWSHLVDFSPLCVIKCVLKLAF